MRRIFAKLGNFFRPGRAERELEREIASNLALLQEDYQGRGLTPPDARLATRRARELHREERSFPWLEQTVQNLRYGARTLLRSPGFTTVAVLTLALGIGANASIFSIINAVLLHPLPYAQSNELVGISLQGLGAGVTVVSFPKFTQLREQARTLESVGALFPNTAGLVGTTGPEQVTAGRVSEGFFRALKVAPVLGRGFRPEEDQEGGRDVALITDGFWHSHLGGDPNVIGRILTLDGKQTSIVGVLPAGFRFPFFTPEPEIWLPRVFENSNYTPERIRAGASYLFVFGRMRPGQTLPAVQAELNTLSSAYEHQFPGLVDASKGLLATTLESVLVGNLRASLLALSAAAGFVLLIACVNVASLLLARATAREREIAVRQALGAARGHLLAQLLAESGLLSFAGGALGVGMAWWGVPVLMKVIAPGTLPGSDQIHVDAPVLLVSLMLCGLTALAFGLVPFLHTWRQDLHDKMKAGSRGSTPGGSGARMRQAMVVSEVALALVLMAGAGLLIRSLTNLMHVNPGFDASNVMTFPFNLASNGYPTPARRNEFFRKFTEQVRVLPNVQSASMVSHLPLSGGPRFIFFCAEGAVCRGLGRDPIVAWRQITPEFFSTLRIPLLQGRAFNEKDTSESRMVAIVNELFAKRYFPDGKAVGRHLANSRDKIPLEIVGVVRDLKFTALNGQSAEELYVPYTQGTWPAMTLVVRSNGNPQPLVAAVRKRALELDPTLPLAGIVSMESVVSSSISQPRLIAGLVGSFAGVALLLATVGIYGVMAYLVTQRSQEMAIRMALGAHGQSILQMVLGQGTRLVSIGVAIGLLVSLGLTRLLSTLLFGTSATDIATLAGVSLLFILVALAACCLPARRAMRLDPTLVLRGQ